MKTLAIEASGSSGGVAVVGGDGGVLFAETFTTSRRGSGELFTVLDAAIGQCGAPDRVAAGTGPGTYNGIRTAIAAAAGLSLACGCGVVGVSSWLALRTDALEYAVAGDARGGVFSWAVVRARCFTEEPALLQPEELRRKIAACGPTPVFSVNLPEEFGTFELAECCPIELARLGVRTRPGETLPEPLYLKPPHITPAGKQKSAREGTTRR